jgi:peroxiredoxin
MSKRWIALAAVITGVFIAFYLYRRYRVAPGIDFSTLALTNMRGERVNLGKLRGQKTIVTFAASWCGPCRQELRDISAAKQRDLSEAVVVVISDEHFEKVLAFSERENYPFLFLKMEQSFGSIGINSIPATYLLNRQFKTVKETVGYINWGDPPTAHHLSTLMESE